MAGERKGKAYEAVVLVALEKMRAAGVFHDPVYWEKTPLGMSIKPDLTIGPAEDSPSHLILVTYSGSAKNSAMKFWRNLGELIEAKTCLPIVPRVFCVTFGAIYEDSEPIQTWAFDEFRWSRGERWHADLDSFAETLTNTSGLATADFPDVVRQQAPTSVLDRMKALLLSCFQASPRPQMNGLWKLHRARPMPLAPSSRMTSVRRGLAKLLVFDDIDLGAKIHDRQRVPKATVPSYAFALGLAQKSTLEAWGADSDIESAITCLGRREAISLARSSMKPRMEAWYYTLRNLMLVPCLAAYVHANYARLCKQSWLGDRLIELHDDPCALVRRPVGIGEWPPPTVWLIEIIIQLIRVSSGSANGYGYAQLANEVLERFGGRQSGGGEPRVFRIVLPDWIHRRDNETLTAASLSQIASVLAAHLEGISVSKAAHHLSELTKGNALHILEQKLIPYPIFDPLGELLRARVPGFEEIRVDACYREASGIGGQAGRMAVGRSRSTLINWQSAHGSHTNDKKKELSGRAVGLRYHWNGSKFIRRPGIDKLILILDGTWKDDDLKALLRAGWDEIYYPDEMDRVAKAIV